MATNMRKAKECTPEEDEYEDLDVQKILSFHLKEVLDLVSKSTIDPTNPTPKTPKTKTPELSHSKKKSFGDTQVSLEKEPHDYITPVPGRASKMISLLSAKKVKKCHNNSTLPNSEINLKEKAATLITKDEKNKLSEDEEAFLENVAVQCNRSASGGEYTKDKEPPSNVKRRVSNFQIFSNTSPGISTLKEKAMFTISDSSEDKEENEEENEEENDEEVEEEEDEEEEEEEDEEEEEEEESEEIGPEQEDFFTIYRTSMYRASVFGPKPETTSSKSEDDLHSHISAHQETSQNTLKGSSVLTDSGSSGKTSTREGYSSHTLFFSNMRDKYKSPLVTLTLDPEDYTPDQRGKEVDILLARHNILSDGRQGILYNSSRQTREIFNTLYKRASNFLRKRIASLRGKAIQNEKVLRFRKSIERQILQTPYLARDSKTGGFKLTQKLTKYNLGDDKCQKELFVTPPSVEVSTKPEDQHLYDFRRKTPFYMKTPLKVKVCGRTDSFSHTGSALKRKNTTQTKSQMKQVATDLLPGPIDHQATVQEKDITETTSMSTTGAESSRTSTSAKFYAGGLESEENLIPLRTKVKSLTKNEILEVLETPEMYKWEHLYVANPNFSLGDHVHRLKKKKTTAHKDKPLIPSRRKSKYNTTVMRLLLLLLLLLLSAPSNRTVIFDLGSPGWTPAWHNLTMHLAVDLSECMLLCTVTSGCIGGRHETLAKRCHLTLSTGGRAVMHFKQKVGAKDPVFGIRCDKRSGFTKFASFAYSAEDVMILPPMSPAECMERCTQNFWCRSVEVRQTDNVCTLGSISNLTHTLSVHGWDFYNRNC